MIISSFMLSKSKFVFLFALLFFACKQLPKTATATSEYKSESGLTPEFLDFYERFHADSTYQLAHIVFPLEGSDYNEDNQAIKQVWNKENWIFHKPFDDYGGTFTRTYTEFGGIITESIVDNNKISSMERRFSKINNEWYLIFYDPIHLTSN